MKFWSKLFGLEAAKTSSSCCCSKGHTFPNTSNLWDIADILEGDKDILKKSDPKIKVGEVLDVQAHSDPKMTKVRVSQVSFGGEPVQILCGGVNLEIGQIVPVATVGTKLSPDFEIGIRDIRGITSNGMICSRVELGISAGTEKKGEIWALPVEFKQALGQSLCDIQ